jgi:hypothetical protein
VHIRDNINHELLEDGMTLQLLNKDIVVVSIEKLMSMLKDLDFSFLALICMN